jgi:hypothetical protein
MTRRALFAIVVTVLLSGLLTLSASGAVDTKADRLDSQRSGNISSFNIGPFPMEYREATAELGERRGSDLTQASRQRPVGSAL